MNMKRVIKFQLIFTGLIFAGGLGLMAILNYTQSSALRSLSYFPDFLCFFLGGTVHSPSTTGYVIGLILEWGLIGLWFSAPLAFIVAFCWKGKDNPQDAKRLNDALGGRSEKSGFGQD
jgi:predicted branched-subunit amino acid permease